MLMFIAGDNDGVDEEVSETILYPRSSHQRTALLSGHAERVTCLHMDTRLFLFLLLLFILITL